MLNQSLRVAVFITHLLCRSITVITRTAELQREIGHCNHTGIFWASEAIPISAQSQFSVMDFHTLYTVKSSLLVVCVCVLSGYKHAVFTRMGGVWAWLVLHVRHIGWCSQFFFHIPLKMSAFDPWRDRHVH